MLMPFFSLGTVMDGCIPGGFSGPAGFWGVGAVGNGPVFSVCPRPVIGHGLPGAAALGPGILGKGPVLSACPRPTCLGPPGAGVSNLGAPGKDALGASGVTFLGTSTPDGFWPDFILVMSSPMVLIEDLYS